MMVSAEGAAASATSVPMPPHSRVRTTPRRSAEQDAAAARTAYCQGWPSARASGIAEPRMAPIAAGPAPSRKARALLVAAQAVEVAGAEQDERERRGEGDGRGEEPARQPGRRVADHGDGLHDRAGRDLAERDGVQELAVGHPVVVANRVGLHQRDDHEAAAVGQRADLERDPDSDSSTASDRAAAEPAERERRQGHPAAGARQPPGRARRRCRALSGPSASSISPQPSRTSTSHGPMVAAAPPPATR